MADCEHAWEGTAGRSVDGVTATRATETGHAVLNRLLTFSLAPHGWGNAPGDTRGWHEHSSGKVLYCARGRIAFHTRIGDAHLGPGDRLALPPHNSSSGILLTRPPSAPKACGCIEASRPGQMSACRARVAA